jgi:hypothetical protein
MEKEPTCLGCSESQPNQMAHMNEGGCINFFSNTNTKNNQKTPSYKASR